MNIGIIRLYGWVRIKSDNKDKDTKNLIFRTDHAVLNEGLGLQFLCIFFSGSSYSIRVMKDAKKFNKEPDLVASRVSTFLCSLCKIGVHPRTISIMVSFSALCTVPLHCRIWKCTVLHCIATKYAPAVCIWCAAQNCYQLHFKCWIHTRCAEHFSNNTKPSLSVDLVHVLCWANIIRGRVSRFTLFHTDCLTLNSLNCRNMQCVPIHWYMTKVLHTYTTERRDVLGCTSPTTKRFPEAREMSSHHWQGSIDFNTVHTTRPTEMYFLIHP